MKITIVPEIAILTKILNFITLISHTNLLRASHQIVELNEAAQIHDSLGQNKITQESAKEQIKDTVKRWKNQLSLYSDPYSHWSD